jgi:Kef-type K+ transport system membrane component KefB
VSRVGAYFLKKVENDENAYFVLMLAILAVSGLLAKLIDLPPIVGAFLAGLAVNAAVHDKPAKEKLEFFGNSLFIPIFFIAIGFLINPILFWQSIRDQLALIVAVVAAVVVGKLIAAWAAGRSFGYSSAARLTMWSLTLPQVAATIAGVLAAHDATNPQGQRLVDEHLLNVVLVVMLTTAILGPVLTGLYAPRMMENEQQRNVAPAA